ncbi:MAG TPA: ABC transporter ATP-binding protein [Cerasibacillus sp.]|uniref:ABC transporter ATP-binding protein n=1 Tax=Cerasibacillus sp. TaxID=2498711 RepID=UPI002F4062A6
MFQLYDVSFRYPDANKDVLNQLHLSINAGEFILLTGPSGCGKTTLLRLLTSVLRPIGELSGEMLYQNKPIHLWSDEQLTKQIGFISQHPEEQMVMPTVIQELVFGLENHGLSTVEMRKRVAELGHFFKIENLLYKKTDALSGGEQQLVHLLSVLLLRPKVLILDEPTSQLDPVHAKHVLQILEQLHHDLGMTIIIAEHRVDHLFQICDRVIMLDEGTVRFTGNSRDMLYQLFQSREIKYHAYLPDLAHLYLEKAQQPIKDNIPLTVNDGRVWLKQTLPMRDSKRQSRNVEQEQPIVTLKDVTFYFSKNAPSILNRLSLTIYKGDFYTIIGGNASGKTTLLEICLGIKKAKRGRVELFQEKPHKTALSRVGFMPQQPQAFFMYDTVEKEMQAMLNQGDDGEQHMIKMAKRFNVEHLLQQHPYDCSYGEMQKVVLACLLLRQPDILFLDEPTKGLDPFAKKELGRYLTALHKEGVTIVMVSHDIDFIANYSKRSGLLFAGEVTTEGPTHTVLQDNYFYTTDLSRAARGTSLSSVLTLEEALQAWPEK